MANNLVIVESPAKAKTIEKFLGKNFKVASSYGHIADLPSNELGVDIEKDFSPKYIVSSEKKKVVSELKSLVKKMNTVSKKDFEKHFNILWVHGLIHLFGYDHKKDFNYKKMKLIEIKLLKKII